MSPLPAEWVHDRLHINTKLLQRFKVCDEGLERFKQHFPHGTSYSALAKLYRASGAKALLEDLEWLDQWLNRRAFLRKRARELRLAISEKQIDALFAQAMIDARAAPL